MEPSLNDLFKEFPHVSLATEDDNEELLAFYHQTELASKTTVRYQRGNDFFKFLKERSEYFLVFTLRDENKKLCGVGVASYRPGYINQQLTTVGYLGDLRIKINRKLIREWRNFYGQLLLRSPTFKETQFCKYYQTAIIDSNPYSKNNLVDTKISNLLYRELAKYKMINIIGFFGLKNQKYKIETAKISDINQIINFLQIDHQQKLFGQDWATEFTRRLNKWEDFHIEDFIILKDHQENILAITSFWDPIKSKQILVPYIPRYYRVINYMLKLIPGFTCSSLPTANQAIKILYLNQISFSPLLDKTEKKKILKALIQTAFLKNFNLLGYCDFDNDNLLGFSLEIISQKISMGLYSVHYKDNVTGIIQAELFINNKNSTPGFEMSLV